MSTLTEKIESNKTIIETNINQTTPELPAAYNEVVAAVIGVAQESLEVLTVQATLENLVKTATLREDGGRLNDIGEQYGVNYKYATTPILNVKMPAADGTEITPQYTFASGDNGLDYSVDGSYIATAGYINFPITCLTDGVAGNLSSGSFLDISSQLAGALSSQCEVVDTDTVGAAEEGIDAYRIRILDEIRNPGAAGNLSFYRKRGKLAAGVKEIFPYRGKIVGESFINPGDVTSYVEATEEIGPDGIPTTAVLEAVEDSISYDEDGIEKLPTTLRELHVRAITRDEVFFTIAGLSVYDINDLGSCESDINNGLDDYLRTMKPFIPGLDYVKEKKNILDNPSLGSVVDDVVKTYNGSYTSISFGFSAGAVSAPHTLAPGQLVKLGTVDYV